MIKWKLWTLTVVWAINITEYRKYVTEKGIFFWQEKIKYKKIKYVII